MRLRTTRRPPSEPDSAVPKAHLVRATCRPNQIRGLTSAQLAGGFGGCADSGTLSGQIEESFLRRLDQLPPQTRRLLLVAAAEPMGAAPGRVGSPTFVRVPVTT